MAQQTHGVLVDKQMHRLIDGPNPALVIDRKDVRTCSADFRTGKTIWHLAGWPNLAKGFSFDHVITHMKGNTFSELETAYPGMVLMCELEGKLNLPKGLWGKSNPKSTAGRMDILSVTVAEGGTAFNVIPEHYDQRVFLIMVSEGIPLKDLHGQDLVQIRFCDGPSQSLLGHEIENLHDRYRIVDNMEPKIVPEGLVLHLDLENYYPEYLVSTGLRKPISLNAPRGTVDPNSYFWIKPMGSGGNLFLEPGEFLLASTIERIRVPPHVCVEMVPYRENMGEYKGHKAGFVDAGFGFGREGEAGSATIVCEIRNISSVPITFSHGQAIAVFRFEYLMDIPDLVYGEQKEGSDSKPSNYQSQVGVRMAKQFKAWPGARIKKARRTAR